MKHADSFIRNQAREVCAAPVNWANVPELAKYCPEAVTLFDKEWIRTFSNFAVDQSDVELLNDVLVSGVIFGDDIEVHTLRNLRDRKPLAVKNFPKGLKYLDKLQFVRPSEQKKHLGFSGPSSEKNISTFDKELVEDDLQYLFWSCFGQIMITDSVLPDENMSFSFLLNVEHLWQCFSNGRQFRVSLNANNSIGRCRGLRTSHIALDIETGGSRIIHAYPVMQREAEKIMRPLHVPTVPFKG